MTQRAAAHLHGGDLADVPSCHRLVESTRSIEHRLRRASTRTRLMWPPLSGVCVQEPCDPDAGRRRTCMVVTWPTSQASTGWLKALAP